MTPEELDRNLRTISEHEARYRTGWTEPVANEGLEAIEHNGRMLHVIRLPEKIAPLSVGKHSRFRSYPAHLHPWIELVYMYSGACTQRLNGTEVTLKRGEAILLNQNTIHELPVIGEDDILLNIYIRKEYLTTGYLSRFSQTNVVTRFLADALSDGLAHEDYLFFPTQGSRRLHMFIQELFCECLDPSSCSKDIQDNLFALILTELMGYLREPDNADSSAGTISVLPVLRYIEQTYQHATLKDAAQRFSVNPDYLSRLLRRRTGHTFMELVTQQRMSAAREMLTNTSLPITDIASRVGYSNVTFFYRKFEASFSCTPGAYREQVQAC